MKRHINLLRSVFCLALFGSFFAAAPPALTAISNIPFFAAKTTYNGLVYPEEGVVPGETGYFRLDVSRTGKFSGKLLVGQQHAGFSGKFNDSGTAYVPVSVGTGQYEAILNSDFSIDYREIKVLKWTVVFQLTNGLDSIVGQILSYERAGWSGIVQGERAGFNARTNAAPQAGRYTMVLPGGSSGLSGPEGDGWATLTVDGAGNVLLQGGLADNFKFVTRSILSAKGVWPFFVPSDGGRGALAGWLQFTNSTESELVGQLIWIRSRHPGTASYAEGFTNQIGVLASRYVPPAPNQPALNLSDPVLVLSGGELSSSVTKALIFRTPSELRGTSGSPPLVKFYPAKGLFLGLGDVPGTMLSPRLSGAVLQNRNVGFGYFTGNARSGEVIIEEKPD